MLTSVVELKKGIPIGVDAYEASLKSRFNAVSISRSELPDKYVFTITYEQGNTPSIVKQAANLATAVGKHVYHGMKTIPEDIAESRLTACTACEKFREDRRCAMCGCFMDVKTHWAEQKCALGKWEH